MAGFFVTGIGTDIGKTIVSAIFVEALKADYWKPIQSGNLIYKDSDFIRDFTQQCTFIHPEDYAFTEPVSPHLAAEIDGKSIDFQHFKLPKTKNHIIVEGAGGLMVPLSEKYLIIDLIKKLQLPVILVSMNYLGSINHTLLSIDVLRAKQIPIAGLVFNGISNSATENYISTYANIPILAKLPHADNPSKGFIVQEANKIKKSLESILSNSISEIEQTNLNIDYESF